MPPPFTTAIIPDVFAFIQFGVVIIPCILQLIFISDHCNYDDNENAIIHTVVLLLVTLIILIVSLIIINRYQREDDFENVKWLLAFLMILWCVQYAFIIDTYRLYRNDSLTCPPAGITITLHGIFSIIVIVYSIFIFIPIVSFICFGLYFIYSHAGCKNIFLILCLSVQTLLVMIMPISQIILLTDDRCVGDLGSLSMVETVFLFIFATLTVLVGSIGLCVNKKQQIHVLIVWLCIFIVQYGLLTHSIGVLLVHEVYCNDMETFVHFIWIVIVFWWSECSMFLLVVAFSLLFACCKR
eukprot:405583_1